jgi:hypothetical protein
MNVKEYGRKFWKPRGSALGRLRKPDNKFKSGWGKQMDENTHRKLVAI